MRHFLGRARALVLPPALAGGLACAGLVEPAPVTDPAAPVPGLGADLPEVPVEPIGPEDEGLDLAHALAGGVIGAPDAHPSFAARFAERTLDPWVRTTTTRVNLTDAPGASILDNEALPVQHPLAGGTLVRTEGRLGSGALGFLPLGAAARSTWAINGDDLPLDLVYALRGDAPTRVTLRRREVARPTPRRASGSPAWGTMPRAPEIPCLPSRPCPAYARATSTPRA